MLCICLNSKVADQPSPPTRLTEDTECTTHFVDANVYCPFCGVILLTESYIESLQSPQTRVRTWCEEVRGVYLANITLGHIAITGIGIVRGQNILYAPLDSRLSYIDVGTESLEEWRLCDPSENSCWCFGFHNSCWKMLLLRLCYEQSDYSRNEAAIVESIFYQLYCAPCLHFSSFQFGHDYDGAAQTHKPFGRPKKVDQNSILYADPCAIPSTDDLEAASSKFCKAHVRPLWKGPNAAHRSIATSTDIDTRGEDDTKGPSTHESNGDSHQLQYLDDRRVKAHANLERSKHHIFDRLSLEMRFKILSYLSFDELLNLRLVCQDLAVLASVNTLPQSYWRSRFLLGQEADFLFPSLKNPRDWYRLFFGTRTFIRTGTLSLVNRKRIRRLLEPIAILVSLEPILRNGPCGYAFHPVQNADTYFQLVDDGGTENTPQYMEIASSFSGQLNAVGADSPLGEGCRLLYYRAQPLTAEREQDQWRICISTVRMGARCFISGINIFPPEDRNARSRLVGYQNPASEKWITIPSTSHPKALCVAFCSEGLVGIRFIFADSNSSLWVGNSIGPGIAQGTISIPNKLNQHYLFAGLDRFKIISLGIGLLTEHSGASLTSPVMDPSSVQSHLWSPHPPRHGNLRISNLLPFEPSKAFEPLTNIDFGGPRGLLLGSLTRVVFYMASDPHPLAGIEIFYSDEASMLYGSNSDCGISFFVNGPKGERINQVGIIEDNRKYAPSTGLGGLQVSTNYGRTAMFAPLHYRLDAAVELIPTSWPGSTITGFVAVELESDNQGVNRYIRFGTQSQQCDPQPTTPDILKSERHLIPDDEIRYDEKFSHFINRSNPGNYQTYASLKNVRRIQASTGITGRSRCFDRISGLKFEYYDHPTPSVVGQWMNELDDGFELSADEEIQSLTTFLAPMGFSAASPGLEVGQVAAIRIETSCSRNVTFQPPEFLSLAPRKLQHQYQSGPGDKLTAISWIFNASSDRVRAVISTDASQNSRILVPEQEPPFDQVQKLYFEMHNDNGCMDTIVTAEAYFRDMAITGLVFVYISGRRVTVGDSNTDTCKTVHFERGSRIVGLSAAVKDDQLMEIEFEVEQDEKSGYKLRLSLDLPHGQDIEYDWRDVWCKDEISAKSYQHTSVQDRVYSPPKKSRLVGIYVGSQFFSHVGVLYETDAF